MSIGGSDGSNSSTIWGESTDNVSTTDCNSYAATDGCIAIATNPSTLSAKASLSTFDPDGYTLDWETADAVERDFFAVLIAPNFDAVRKGYSLLAPRQQRAGFRTARGGGRGLGRR